MNANDQNPVIMTEEDFQLLKPYLSQLPAQDGEMTLTHELNRAVIVSKEAFPPHTIKLNSKVSVLDMDTDRVMEFTIVMPAHADMRQNKISVLTPMGTALIGFRKAEEVRWKVPAGLKRFRILDVVNRQPI